ncbi:S1 family peptidase [Umezawaea beigongshangensis]|uniref:S1 family peptidase n=1 Tax=Umezawaea beigongshangensis TaxID=2780383 RepID=UPI0018F24226|nr:trypsin-like serine protease [Umezawaea beigongshangensis]
MRSIRTLFSTGAVAVALAVALPGSAAAIVGGRAAPATPWVVKVNQGDIVDCTGSVVAARWVLTARHCADETAEATSVDVAGTEIAVDRKVVAPQGDVALLHLVTATTAMPVRLGTSDPVLSTFPVGTMFGWGAEGPGGPIGVLLKSALVDVIGFYTDAHGGRTIGTSGSTGAGWHGDSGGPLLVGGRLVGVASSVLGQDGSNPYAHTDFASVAAHRGWIRTAAGV